MNQSRCSSGSEKAESSPILARYSPDRGSETTSQKISQSRSSSINQKNKPPISSRFTPKEDSRDVNFKVQSRNSTRSGKSPIKSRYSSKEVSKTNSPIEKQSRCSSGSEITDLPVNTRYSPNEDSETSSIKVDEYRSTSRTGKNKLPISTRGSPNRGPETYNSSPIIESRSSSTSEKIESPMNNCASNNEEQIERSPNKSSTLPSPVQETEVSNEEKDFSESAKANIESKNLFEENYKEDKNENHFDEDDMSSLMPHNELPVPEPVPPKPRLESRVLISAASSCTLPSQCTTPEPVEDKTTGGYEDILDVLERLEDELDGKEKSAGVNFINVLRMNFSYERPFWQLFLDMFQLWHQNFVKKCARKL